MQMGAARGLTTLGGALFLYPDLSHSDYNNRMKPRQRSVLDRLLDPLGRILTAEVAEQLVQIRFDRQAQARIDRLARKCNEGKLTDEERSEYETYVHTIDFIAILQAKARALLKQSTAPR
jgi:hypothetical protein